MLENHVEIKQFHQQFRSMQDLQNMVTFLWNLQEVWEDDIEKEAGCHVNSGYVDDKKEKSKK